MDLVAQTHWPTTCCCLESPDRYSGCWGSTCCALRCFCECSNVNIRVSLPWYQAGALDVVSSLPFGCVPVTPLLRLHPGCMCAGELLRVHAARTSQRGGGSGRGRPAAQLCCAPRQQPPAVRRQPERKILSTLFCEFITMLTLGYSFRTGTADLSFRLHADRGALSLAGQGLPSFRTQ